MTRASLLLAAAVVLGSSGAAGAIAFSRADLNHDGVVTFEEAKRVMPQLKKVLFQKSDPNGDGMLTQREYPLLDNLYWTLETND
jgi:hypothetical protein